MKAETIVLTDKMPRRLRKVLVERKRRERIEGCLQQIKQLIMNDSDFQNEKGKMEKADILESVLRFIQLKTTNVSCRSPAASKAEYRQGYISCMKEISQLLEPVYGHSHVSTKLMYYMNNKLNNMELISPPSTRSHYSPQNVLNRHLEYKSIRRNLNFSSEYKSSAIAVYSVASNQGQNTEITPTTVPYINFNKVERLSSPADSTMVCVTSVKQESQNIWRPW
jgi:hypothetical protein